MAVDPIDAELTPSQRGAVAETAIAAHATRLGIEVYRPIAEGGRFDLVFVMRDGSLRRIQCKSAARRGGVIVIGCETCRRTGTGYLRRRYTAEEIDLAAASGGGGDRSYLLRAG